MTGPVSNPMGVHDVPALAGKPLIVQGLMVGSGAPPTAQVTPDPLANADQFTLTRNINPPQLASELSEALSVTVLTALTAYVDGVSITADNPAVLWISPAGLDPNVIQTVIDNHTPSATFNVPIADLNFSAVVEKAVTNQGAVFSEDEKNAALAGLLADYNSRQSTTIEPSSTPTTSTS